jgi:preprotein translocase subunit SecF
MFEVIRPGTKYDFVGGRTYAMIGSLVVIVLGMISIAVRGINWGIDFSGGTMVHLRFQQPVSIGDIRSALADLSTGGITVQDFGGASNEFMARMPESDPELKKGLAAKVTGALKERFQNVPFEVLRVESVGPRVGKDLRRRAMLAVIASTVMMGIYIAFRFEIRFGVGAAVALFHDVLITIGALSLLGYEFDLNIVAALLTIIGFSVNDTVIVSDRIRENMRKNRRDPLATLINRSINETLSRTILTTGTALLVIVVLFVVGGEMIHGFAFALLVGFTVGTYSSIFIATPVVLSLDWRARPRAKAA